MEVCLTPFYETHLFAFRDKDSMSNAVTVCIPFPDVAEARLRGWNISEICRVAIRQKLDEEQKSEKETGANLPGPTPATTTNGGD